MSSKPLTVVPSSKPYGAAGKKKTSRRKISTGDTKRAASSLLGTVIDSFPGKNEPEDETEAVNVRLELAKLVRNSTANNLPAQELCRRQLILCLAAIETAEKEYERDPRQGQAFALTSLLQTAQSLIEEVEQRTDPRLLVDEVKAKVIQPLLTAFIRALTSESHRRRASLTILAPDKASMVDREMKEMMLAIGQESTTAMTELVATLNTVLGVIDD